MPPRARCADNAARATRGPAVERGRGLVEDPQRARRQRETREMHAPPLALRQHARRQRRLRGEPDGGERRLHRCCGGASSAASATSDARFSCAVSSSLNAGAWPTKTSSSRSAASNGATRCPPPRDRSLLGVRQPGEDAQQRRLAGAVGAAHDQRVAFAERERDVAATAARCRGARRGPARRTSRGWARGETWGRGGRAKRAPAGILPPDCSASASAFCHRQVEPKTQDKQRLCAIRNVKIHTRSGGGRIIMCAPLPVRRP